MQIDLVDEQHLDLRFLAGLLRANMDRAGHFVTIREGDEEGDIAAVLQTSEGAVVVTFDKVVVGDGGVPEFGDAPEFGE